MNTLEFFQQVLPATGPYYCVTLGDNGQRHVLFNDLKVLAEKSLALDKNGKESIYFATATYRDAHVMKDDPANPGKQKKAWRVPENRLRLKSFFVDIDCGEEKAALGKGYATKKEGVSALQKFCSEMDLPVPIIVDSGGGLHCYWPLTKDISHEKWSAVAAAFKRATLERSFLADPSRTADSASILRTPGTFNRKHAVPRPVCVKHGGGGSISPEEFVSKLQDSGSTGARGAGLVTVAEVPSYLKDAVATPNGLAKHKTEYPPASALEIAKKCQQLAAMRDTKGQVEYPIWFASIGLIKHCTEGLDLAQEWSSGDPSYSEYATTTKFHSWEKGPPTCEFFYGSNPKGCDGCKYRENDGSFKYTSPIQLGTVMPEPKPEMQLQIHVTPGAAPVMVTRPQLPDGYDYDDRLVRYLADKEGDIQTHVLTTADFYVYGWSNEDNVFAAQCRLHQPQGGIIEFDLPMKVVNSAADLLKELSSRSIMPTNNKDAGMHLTAYVRDSINRIKEETKELSTVRSFGWLPDMSGFVLGSTLYGTDGTVRTVRLANNAETLAQAVFPGTRGSLDGYISAVNYVYGRPGMEPMQYAYCNAFGSLLTPFSTETLYRGVMFAITGGRTARGKTTVANAALFAFGDARRMTHTKSSTINSRYNVMGTHGNVSLLFDEFTDIAEDELSEWAYSISEGREKSRLTSNASGVSIAKAQEWAMSPYVTANTDMLARLAQHRANTHAEAMRIVQLPVDDYELPQLDPNSVSNALFQMSQNMGHVGEKFVEYITTHSIDVAMKCAKNMQACAHSLVGPELRYYRAHMACTLSAAEILVDMGLVQFDMNRLWDFAVSLFTGMKDAVDNLNKTEITDVVGRMIAELSPRIITTFGYNTGTRTAPEEVRMYHAPAGRLVIGNPQTRAEYHGRLFLSRPELTRWCHKERIPVRDVLKALQDRGALIDDNLRTTLTKGTTMAGTPVHCISVNTNMLDEDWLPKPAIAA